MARSYKRDKNGQFASTGGGSSVRSTVQAKRSIGSNRTQASTQSGLATRRSQPLTPPRGKKSVPELQSATRKWNARTERRSNMETAASSSGGASTGRSLRQTVQAKRSVGSGSSSYKDNGPLGVFGPARRKTQDTGMHKGGLHVAHTGAANKRAANRVSERYRNDNLTGKGGPKRKKK